MVEEALAAPDEPRVLIIEEINRGNPAMIFGELLTLIEVSKRTPAAAMHLIYAPPGDEPVYIPGNLFIIGTMNMADRSLAMLDIALRRRFAFVELKPLFNDLWMDWMVNSVGMPKAMAEEIRRRIQQVNAKISSNNNLGQHCVIGHSYVTPGRSLELSKFSKWYHDVVTTELVPLLDEYFLDYPEDLQECRNILIPDLPQ